MNNDGKKAFDVLRKIELNQLRWKIGEQIFGGITEARNKVINKNTLLAFDSVIANICNDPTLPPANYQCGGFEKFECKADYDCENIGFDCGTFDCGDGTNQYHCDAGNDFMCGGMLFQCTDEFLCAGGHMFFCTSSHDCIDQFDCSAGGVPCDATAQYDPGDPGDFDCGMTGEVPGGTFNCTDEFLCNSTTDFQCQGTETEFNCKSTFKCSDETHFTCSAPSDPFDCPSGFDCKCYSA